MGHDNGGNSEIYPAGSVFGMLATTFSTKLGYLLGSSSGVILAPILGATADP